METSRYNCFKCLISLLMDIYIDTFEQAPSTRLFRFVSITLNSEKHLMPMLLLDRHLPISMLLFVF